MSSLSFSHFQFTNVRLLQQALTHRSFGADHNERLEFLGDSLLNFIIASALYQQFPSAKEGELSRLRAKLVKGETLSQIARELQLGEHLRLGTGEKKSGGHERDSILADTVEAIIGAIYLDSDITQCRNVVLGWYQKRLDKLDLKKSHKDAKSKLQEILQARQMSLPDYHLQETSGEAHRQHFVIRCELKELGWQVSGEGKSRKIAEQNAAALLVAKMESEL